MIDLYAARTGNGFRVAIALEEAGLAYRTIPVDLRSPRSADYLALNPTGRIPTIVDHDATPAPLVLTQSTAIILYAARKSRRLLPEGEAEQAHALEWMMAFTTDVIVPSFADFILRMRLGERAAEASDLLHGRAMVTLPLADLALSRVAFLSGAEFGVADVVAYPIVSALEGVDWGALPALKAWHERVGARPAVQRGMSILSAS